MQQSTLPSNKGDSPAARRRTSRRARPTRDGTEGSPCTALCLSTESTPLTDSMSAPVHVLGIDASHGAVVASEAERFTRTRHSAGFPAEPVWHSSQMGLPADAVA